MDATETHAFANAHSTHRVSIGENYGRDKMAMIVKKEHKRKRMQILKKDENYR